MLVLFDIDGTLLDGSHREHLIDRPDPDWRGFFDAAAHDPAVPAMTKLIGALKPMVDTHPDWDFVFATGRSEQFRGSTRAILRDRFDLDEPVLLMRGRDDDRHDVEVKRDMLSTIQSMFGRYPDIAFEDRQPIVDMLRRRGIFTCHVSDGDSWGNRAFPSPSELQRLLGRG